MNKEYLIKVINDIESKKENVISFTLHYNNGKSYKYAPDRNKEYKIHENTWSYFYLSHYDSWSEGIIKNNTISKITNIEVKYLY